ncbi:hypothetical protein LY78DRAFT_348784 [Colletotrichum sublineola]|nr:hypothetical protein LY78DRAFT_348784 [Colletotrichum sublineola]
MWLAIFTASLQAIRGHLHVIDNRLWTFRHIQLSLEAHAQGDCQTSRMKWSMQPLSALLMIPLCCLCFTGVLEGGRGRGRGHSSRRWTIHIGVQCRNQYSTRLGGSGLQLSWTSRSFVVESTSIDALTTSLLVGSIRAARGVGFFVLQRTKAGQACSAHGMGPTTTTSFHQ